MHEFSLKRWSRTTFGLVTIVGIVFALTTLAIGIIVFEATHEALEQQLDHRIATETAIVQNNSSIKAKAAPAFQS